tara:strand:+ start:1624 stop:1803 length:180 start_codon:yes stop_codon:yes gene_type:complete
MCGGYTGEHDQMAFKVTARERKTETIIAEYIFESLKEATKFHASMLGKGYYSNMERIYV